jgi:hypothetical protein
MVVKYLARMTTSVKIAKIQSSHRTPRRATTVLLTTAAALVVPVASVTAASTTVTKPPANGQYDYQIGGAYKPDAAVKIVDRDRTSKPAAGFYNVCYINAFQSQAEDARWWKRHHPHLLLHDAKGHLVEDPGWPGEYMLNTATKHSRAKLAKVEDRWLDGCKNKGFDAIEPDNLDSNTRSHHLLTQTDDFAFAKLLIAHAHAVGLAIAQKNSAGHTKLGAKIGFDFAIAEECQVYDECQRYTKHYGDLVYEVEYTDNALKYYKKACRARGEQISVILRDRDVTPRGNRHYHYEAC